MSLGFESYLDACSEELERTLDALELAGPQVPVPTCPGWTTGDLADHLRALSDHGVAIDVVLAHDGGLRDGELPDSVRVEHVRLSDHGAASHDPERLAQALGELMLAHST